MYRYCLMLLLLLPIAQVGADIYKSVDDEGVTRFGDVPAENAEKYVPPPVNTVPMPKWEPPPAPAAKATPDAFRYRDFRITRPGNDQAFFDSEGKLSVAIDMDPALMEDHRIAVFIDGKRRVASSRALSHQLRAIDRGTHKVHAEVYYADGSLIQKSPGVVFHMRKPSSLRGAPQTGPVDANGQVIRPGPQSGQFVPGPRPGN